MVIREAGIYLSQSGSFCHLHFTVQWMLYKNRSNIFPECLAGLSISCVSGGKWTSWIKMIIFGPPSTCLHTRTHARTHTRVVCEFPVLCLTVITNAYIVFRQQRAPFIWRCIWWVEALTCHYLPTAAYPPQLPLFNPPPFAHLCLHALLIYVGPLSNNRP